MLFGIGLFCLDRLAFGNIPSSAVSADDVAHWPYSPGLLVKWVSFFGDSSLACGWYGSWGWWYFLS